MSELTKIDARIKFIKYYDESSNYTIMEAYNKNFGKFSIVGKSYELKDGDYVDCEGAWKENKKFGLQFESIRISSKTPDDLESMLDFFSSGIIKGIGPATAQKILNKFGTEINNVLDNYPEQLLQVQGVGVNTLARIVESWNKKRNASKTIEKLTQYGLEFSQALSIFKRFGSESLDIIDKNPYELIASIIGFTFKIADRIALTKGVLKDDPIRVLSGILYVLKESQERDGHCALEYNILLNLTRQILYIKNEQIEKVLEEGVRTCHLILTDVNGVVLVQDYKIFKVEQNLSKKISQILSAKMKKIPALDSQIEAGINASDNIALTDEQIEAVKESFKNKINIINGGPGVGKTTILKQIISIIKRSGYSLLLCAPTGRAAKRMTESTGHIATTIHRALEYNPQFSGFQKDKNDLLEADFILTDEFSMVDIFLTNSLVDAIKPSAHFIIIGDTNQLPSIGPGSVLKDLINSKKLNVSKVTKIHRQAESSKIIKNAHKVNLGEYINYENDKDSDFFFIQTKDDKSALEKIKFMLIERIPSAFNLDPKTEVQILTPTHKNLLGTQNLNKELQSLLNPGQEGKEIKRMNTVFKENDNVMQTKNDYERLVFNGDVGIITSVERQGLSAVFDEREVDYDKADLDELSLSYAVTIHKSQGSEYPAVIIPISSSFSYMLDRSLLYTGITRGKKLVVLIGSKVQFEKAIKNEVSRQRITLLTEKIKKDVV
jgi:exodeoxyribonuclease V alpha subunit